MRNKDSMTQETKTRSMSQAGVGEVAMHPAKVYESSPFQCPWEGLGIIGCASSM